MKVRRPRLSPRRLTLRARLTVIYAALFFIAGAVLLGTTYVLFDRNAPEISFNSAGTDPNTTGIQHDREELQVDTNQDARQWDQRLRESAATSLLTQGAIALVIVGAAAGGLGWLIATRVLAPLHRVTETARRIAAAPAADRGLHERISLDGPDDDVKELADTFDTMVARLDRSFDSQRHFVANASHELRTPLTLGRGLVEVAMHRDNASDDLKQLGADLLKINNRHERLISGLLLLANSENEITDPHPVDLADIVTHVVAHTTGAAPDSGVTVHTDAGEAPTTGNALLLERLVHNLVENAIRYNIDDEGWVRVASRSIDGDRVELEVSNSGPAIPPYEVSGLFEPFRRLESQRLVTAGGAGLGLSIVRSVARTHGGDASATARTGGGLTITVTLPHHPL